MINLIVKAKDTADIAIVHPGTKATLGTFAIAGPDHPATMARRRELDDMRMKPNYKPDFIAELKGTLCARTVGWSGVKDTNTGEEVACDAVLLPDLYDQEWLRAEVLEGVGGNEVFFKN